ncbi:MAG TPA: GNAT family N-acetyltransferase [Symbiobacteriaceae bacterium]|nr:GNAT family N-acetyltransferase [Symbiobacteriaceae bacterium]
MTYTIRPFCEQDYEAFAAVSTIVYDHTISAESMRRDDQTRDPRCLHRVWLAESDGQVVGFGEYVQFPGVYHPRKFDVGVGVLPSFRRLGIGTALYETVFEGLRPLDPISLSCGVREDWPGALAFAERRGFVEEMRSWESHLDLTTFDPTAFMAAVEAVRAQGYELRAYPELPQGEDYARRIHAMHQETRRDVPSTEPLTEVPFEQWYKHYASPTFFPEAYWVALKDGELVGMSNIWKTDDPAVLNTGLTATRRAHRGNDVAKALKVCSLTAAKAAGYKRVRTWNATQNHGMLAINGWLGFVRQPAWISLTLQIHPEE